MRRSSDSAATNPGRAWPRPRIAKPTKNAAAASTAGKVSDSVRKLATIGPGRIATGRTRMNAAQFPSSPGV